jgi:hypothetical protein
MRLKHTRRHCCPLLLILIHWMRLPAAHPERQLTNWRRQLPLVFEGSGGNVAGPTGNLAGPTSTRLSVPCFNDEILDSAAEVIV